MKPKFNVGDMFYDIRLNMVIGIVAVSPETDLNQQFCYFAWREMDCDETYMDFISIPEDEVEDMFSNVIKYQ